MKHVNDRISNKKEYRVSFNRDEFGFEDGAPVKLEELYESFFDLFPSDFDVEKKSGEYPRCVYDIMDHFSNLAVEKKMQIYNTGLEKDSFYKLVATVVNGDSNEWRETKREMLDACCRSCTGASLDEILGDTYDCCSATLVMAYNLWSKDAVDSFGYKFIRSWHAKLAPNTPLVCKDTVTGFILFLKLSWKVSEVILPECCALMCAEYMNCNVPYQQFLVKRPNVATTTTTQNDGLVYGGDVKVATHTDEVTFRNADRTNPKACTDDGDNRFFLLFYLCKVDLLYHENPRDDTRIDSVPKAHFLTDCEPMSPDPIIPCASDVSHDDIMQVKMKFQPITYDKTVCHYRNPETVVPKFTEVFQVWIEPKVSGTKFMAYVHPLVTSNAYSTKELLNIDIHKSDFAKFKFRVGKLLFGRNRNGTPGIDDDANKREHHVMCLDLQNFLSQFQEYYAESRDSVWMGEYNIPVCDGGVSTCVFLSTHSNPTDQRAYNRLLGSVTKPRDGVKDEGNAKHKGCWFLLTPHLKAIAKLRKKHGTLQKARQVAGDGVGGKVLNHLFVLSFASD